MSVAGWFWGGLTAMALLWYLTVTVYVAVRGASDLRVMLRRLTRPLPPELHEGEEDWQLPADRP